MFPNRYKKKDKKFTAVFYNTLPYPVEIYGIDFEGRKRQHTKELEPGHKRKEETTFTIPWVLKRSNDSKRLHAFVGSRSGLVFKGELFGAKEGSEIHVIVNDKGKYWLV